MKHMVWRGGICIQILGMLCLYVELLANQHGSCKMFKRNDTILHTIILRKILLTQPGVLSYRFVHDVTIVTICHFLMMQMNIRLSAGKKTCES